MYSFKKIKKYFFVLFIIIVFLVIPFSIFAEEQNQNEITQYQFPEFNVTIHAKPEGGMWNDPNTLHLPLNRNFFKSPFLVNQTIMN